MVVVAARVAVAGVVFVLIVASVVMPLPGGWRFWRVLRVTMIVVVMGMVVIVGHQSASGWGSAMCSSMSASTPETC